MALHRTDREDLMRDAVALSPRIEIAEKADADLIFLGFKRDGSLSIYFYLDPVYQFDASGQLCRAYVDDLLYRTQGTTLAELRREETAERTVLHRVDLSEEQLHEFLKTMTARLQGVLDLLNSETFVLCNQVPVDEDHTEKFRAKLDEILSAPIVLAPAFKGRR